ncbi:hypothetical protein BD770DRAFT_414860 [Pilaira anomala]|nr:hypothetical protein BD770DRAFT_414860 [Pilaira anomala]
MAMTGVAMIGVALTNTGVALVVVVMMFLTISNSHFRNIAICSLLALESKRTKRLLKRSWEVHVSLLISELLVARVVLLWDSVSNAAIKFCEFYFLASMLYLGVSCLLLFRPRLRAVRAV